LAAGGPDQQLEIVVAVLADIGDAVAGGQSRRDQGVGDLVRVAVELTEGRVPPLEAEGDGVGPDLRVIAGDVAQSPHAVEIHRGHQPGSLVRPL
jgi:hypothetical protein